MQETFYVLQIDNQTYVRELSRSNPFMKADRVRVTGSCARLMQALTFSTPDAIRNLQDNLLPQVREVFPEARIMKVAASFVLESV